MIDLLRRIKAANDADAESIADFGPQVLGAVPETAGEHRAGAGGALWGG